MADPLTCEGYTSHCRMLSDYTAGSSGIRAHKSHRCGARARFPSCVAQRCRSDRLALLFQPASRVPSSFFPFLRCCPSTLRCAVSVDKRKGRAMASLLRCAAGELIGSDSAGVAPGGAGPTFRSTRWLHRIRSAVWILRPADSKTMLRAARLPLDQSASASQLELLRAVSTQG